MVFLTRLNTTFPQTALSVSSFQQEVCRSILNQFIRPIPHFKAYLCEKAQTDDVHCLLTVMSMSCCVTAKICQCHSSATLMWHMELSCNYKQQDWVNCTPAERGSSHLCHQVAFIHTAILIMASTLKQRCVPTGESASAGQGSSQPEPDSDPNLKPVAEAGRDPSDTLTAQPQSPLPEAEYDKLLVSRKSNFSLLTFTARSCLVLFLVLSEEQRWKRSASRSGTAPNSCCWAPTLTMTFHHYTATGLGFRRKHSTVFLQ